ncbi:hypothetical protein BH20ACT5_BH20ACT5_21840 [soil metagenome]
MSAAAVAAALAAADGSVEDSFGLHCADVPRERWVPALLAGRDTHGLRYFDWLTGVDELDDGFAIVAHLLDPDTMTHLLVRTRVPRVDPRLATATSVYKGASWHERETAEMYGVTFTDHPNPTPLLLPDGFEGHPLRKEFVLAARVAKAWPGAKEPGESDRDVGRSRRKIRPPGVPDPAEWGPEATPQRPEATPPGPEATPPRPADG